MKRWANYWLAALVAATCWIFFNNLNAPHRKSPRPQTSTTKRVAKTGEVFDGGPPKRLAVNKSDNKEREGSILPPSSPTQERNIPAENLPAVFHGYLRLEGITFYGHNHHQNRALLTDLVTRRTARYSLDEALPYGNRLARILKDRIIIEKEGQSITLRLHGSLDDRGGREKLAQEGYRRVAGQEWLIRPNTLLKDNRHIEKSLQGAEIIAAEDRRGRRRWQIEALKEGSLFRELGLRAGDTIESVNGEELAGLPDVLTAYLKARKSPQITLRLRRSEKALDLSYWMVPDGEPTYNVAELVGDATVERLFSGN